MPRLLATLDAAIAERDAYRALDPLLRLIAGLPIEADWLDDEIASYGDWDTRDVIAPSVTAGQVRQVRALLDGTPPDATAGTLYMDLADHEHQWQQIESRTDADTGRVWHRVQCAVCGLTSEVSA